MQTGWEVYRSHRKEWESQLTHLANYLGYDWDEVTGDRDLRDAAEEMDDTGEWGKRERERAEERVSK